MTQVIAVHSEAAVEYTWPLTITETTGKDISAAPIKLTLGTWTESGGDWRDPDTDVPDGTSSRVVQLLVGGDLLPAAGTYYLWSRVTDSPEEVPRRHARIIIT